MVPEATQEKHEAETEKRSSWMAVAPSMTVTVPEFNSLSRARGPHVGLSHV